MKKGKLTIKQTEKINHNISYPDRIKNIQTFGYGLEVHLTEHCNLNCKGCSHFSPLADEEFMKIEVFERDIARMSQLFGRNEIMRITLLGGEPLLHPQVNDFMKTVVKYFPNMPLQLVTNGLLLPKMSQSFWETCRTTGTHIRISRYPIKLDFPALEKKAQEEGVGVIVHPRENFRIFRRDVYDLSGMQNERFSHSACELFGYCCQLNNGRFYPCTISAYFHHLNRFFKLGISISDNNFIDIHKAKSKDEFYKLITAPVPCCKHCNLNAREFDVKWERSKQNLDEWTHTIAS